MSRLVIRSARTIGDQGLSNLASGLVVATLIVLFLYMGREILEPLVIAALLGFILAPLIRRLRGWGLGRFPSVILTVLVAIGVIGGLGSTIVLQVGQLAEELPKYETNLRAKIRTIGGGALTSSALERASGTLRDLQTEITKSGTEAGPRGQKPLLVEVRQPEPQGLESIANVVRPLLSPLATTALAILFLMFILLQREDIRDRFLRLAGTADLQRSTAALDDAASRLSRFFLMQTILNAGFGIFIGTGLWIIGVPNAVLWGILAGLMRFVPFVGTLIAVFFPLLLAAAVDPGWTMVLATAALFAVAEPVAGHVIEPILYGQHTGLSPVAIVVATLFWALLWGPIGLLLATPLTVCLVVLGRHIEALEFIEVLLGDEPALEPEERFYQRLLAGDATEAADQAEKALKAQSLSAYYDSVPMKALTLAQADAGRGRLAADKQKDISKTIDEIVDDLDDHVDQAPDAEENEASAQIPILAADQLRPAWRVEHPVLCIASRSPLDEAAAAMLTQLLARQGVSAVVQPFAEMASSRGIKINAPDAPLVCLSYFGAAGNPAHVRFQIRRLKRLMPNTQFLAGFWMLGADQQKAEEWRAAVGAHFVATSLTDAVAICVREASEPEAATRPVTKSSPAVVASIEGA